MTVSIFGGRDRFSRDPELNGRTDRAVINIYFDSAQHRQLDQLHQEWFAK